MVHSRFESIEKWEDEIEEMRKEKDALDLLIQKGPGYCYKDTEEIDFVGKDLWTYRNEWRKREKNNSEINVIKAYYCKVIAAKNFQRLGERERYPKNVDTLEKAAFSYDKAAKNADWLNLYEKAAICRIKACKIYDFLKKITKTSKYDKDLKHATEHIKEIAKPVEDNLY
jgi:hypothetical protein